MNALGIFVPVSLLGSQQGWGERRRSCPPPYGLLLYLTMTLTPALLLRLSALRSQYIAHRKRLIRVEKLSWFMYIHAYVKQCKTSEMGGE
jgi:hypothetical protein